MRSNQRNMIGSERGCTFCIVKRYPQCLVVPSTSCPQINPSWLTVRPCYSPHWILLTAWDSTITFQTTLHKKISFILIVFNSAVRLHMHKTAYSLALGVTWLLSANNSDCDGVVLTPCPDEGSLVALTQQLTFSQYHLSLCVFVVSPRGLSFCSPHQPFGLWACVCLLPLSCLAPCFIRMTAQHGYFSWFKLNQEMLRLN